MEQNKTGTLMLTVIGVLTLLIAVIGATFAFFTANLSGNPDEPNLIFTSGRLDITFANGTANLETANNVVPQTPTDEWPHGAPVIIKEFTITGNNSTETMMPYRLNLVVTENTFTSGALTYTLTSINTSGDEGFLPSVLSLTEINNVPSGEQLTIHLGDAYFDGPVTNSVHTYTLRIFFRDSDENQSENLGQSFGAFIQTTVQTVTATTTGT